MKVDKEKQRESLEKLSKPRNARNPSSELGIKDEADLEVHRAKEKLAEEGGNKGGEDEDVGGDDGFGDMDEKQYIRVMKALGLDPGITAKKKKGGGGKRGGGGGGMGGLGLETSYDSQFSNDTDSTVNVGSVVVGREEGDGKESFAKTSTHRDFRQADFVNDSSVIKEVRDEEEEEGGSDNDGGSPANHRALSQIDDVFAELESDKWGSAVGGGGGANVRGGAVEEESNEYKEEDYQFEESADEGESRFDLNRSPEFLRAAKAREREESENKVEEEEEEEDEEEGEGGAEAAQRKWNFSGHSNNEGIMAHASSALDAAEHALNGLLGVDSGEVKPKQKVMKELFNEAIEVQLEPWEKFERGMCNFFDRSSSAEKGRFRVRDARAYAPDSMRRREDYYPGVMLLVGKRNGAGEGANEQCITILFDKSKYGEEDGANWWEENRHRFIGGGKYDGGGDR